MASVVTVNDVLGGRVGLDLTCLDRIYLNGYVPTLQVAGQVFTFLTRHLGKPIASPAVFERIGDRFRRAMAAFAKANAIPVVRFGKNDRKIDVMRPYQDRLAAAGRCGVAAIGVAQEYQSVWTGYQRDGGGDLPRFTFVKATRRVSCYYVYVVDEQFGPGFVRSVRTSPTRSRCGSMATSGPNARPGTPGSISPNCPTGSPPAPTRWRCRPSATGLARPRSTRSVTAGSTHCPPH